jgi:hypothetical protein
MIMKLLQLTELNTRKFMLGGMWNTKKFMLGGM